MNDDADISFVAANSPRLREAGLRGGFAAVTFRNAALEFLGQESGGVRLAADKLDRLRLGYEQGRGGHPHFQALIWPAGERKPILILPLGDEANKAAYGAAMRAYAVALAQARGLDRVERGVSVLSTLMGLLFVAFPAGLFVVVALRSATEANWLGSLVGGLVIVGLTAAMYWAYQGRSRPRRVKDLGELDRFTPGPAFRF